MNVDMIILHTTDSPDSGVIGWSEPMQAVWLTTKFFSTVLIVYIGLLKKGNTIKVQQWNSTDKFINRKPVTLLLE
jgi:hypothetical protein